MVFFFFPRDVTSTMKNKDVFLPWMNMFKMIEDNFRDARRSLASRSNNHYSKSVFIRYGFHVRERHNLGLKFYEFSERRYIGLWIAGLCEALLS